MMSTTYYISEIKEKYFIDREGSLLNGIIKLERVVNKTKLIGLIRKEMVFIGEIFPKFEKYLQERFLI